jgi:hypothetical protein
LTLLGACGDPEAATYAAPSPAPAQTEIELGTEAWQRLPVAERAARIRAWQTSAGPEFAVQVSRPGVLAAAQRRMGLAAEFRAGSASVLAASSDGVTAIPIELAATAWGCAGSMSELSATWRLAIGRRVPAQWLR